MQLSIEAQNAARVFVNSQARPLEQALYAFHFQGGEADAVLAALSSFQNADGGFGNGLEPDVQLANSSAIVTTVGLQHLRDLKAGADNLPVQQAMAYLLHDLRSIDPDVADHPRQRGRRAPRALVGL